MNPLNIWNGNKTYVMALVSIIGAVLLLCTHQIGFDQASQIVGGSILAVCVRHDHGCDNKSDS